MATVDFPVEGKGVLQPDLYEKILAGGAILLFVLVVVALVRGSGSLERVPGLLWLHLVTVLTPLVITPLQLLRRRGDATHRLLGWLWAIPLFATALISFGIRDISHGGLSFIHLFSVVTMVAVPLLVFAGRHHMIARHRGTARGLVTGALLTAGYFTLLPSRMLGGWLWG